jgi:hypothetical protein
MIRALLSPSRCVVSHGKHTTLAVQVPSANMSLSQLVCEMLVLHCIMHGNQPPHIHPWH